MTSCTQINTSLLDVNKSIEWNIYRQFNLDLDQQLLPGFMYNPQAFYMPEEVQEEFTEWLIKNFKSFSKNHATIVTKEIFKKELDWIIINIYPTSSIECAGRSKPIVYKDWDL